jgi:cob(I)alamin adenosyltransferase
MKKDGWKKEESEKEESDFDVLKRGNACGEPHLAQSIPEREAKGLLTIFTGKGKGKSSAAFTMGQRALSAGLRVGVVQFCGGSAESSAYQSLTRHPACDFKIFGSDCTWKPENRVSDIATVNFAWVEAKDMLCDPTYHMVLLDDINLLIKHNFLDLDQVKLALRLRPKHMHVVMTGRHAPFELIDVADIVTEMRQLKHPHSAKAPLLPQAGIEY